MCEKERDRRVLAVEDRRAKGPARMDGSGVSQGVDDGQVLEFLAVQRLLIGIATDFQAGMDIGAMLHQIAHHVRGGVAGGQNEGRRPSVVQVGAVFDQPTCRRGALGDERQFDRQDLHVRTQHDGRVEIRPACQERIERRDVVRLHCGGERRHVCEFAETCNVDHVVELRKRTDSRARLAIDYAVILPKVRRSRRATPRHPCCSFQEFTACPTTASAISR